MGHKDRGLAVWRDRRNRLHNKESHDQWWDDDDFKSTGNTPVSIAVSRIN